MNDVIPPAPAPRRIVCARCKTTFDCGLGEDCWCMDQAFRLPVPAAGGADDCLCPDCLGAAKDASPV